MSVRRCRRGSAPTFGPLRVPPRAVEENARAGKRTARNGYISKLHRDEESEIGEETQIADFIRRPQQKENG